MSEKIKEIIDEIEALKNKLAEELDAKQNDFAYEIKNGYVHFEKEVLAKQKLYMKDLLTYFSEIPPIQLLIAPLVYGMILPAIVFDMMLFVYQQVVFRIYKFEFVKRSDYIVFDRNYLAYLNIIEKINCMYCSYFNGLMQYASRIAAQTERYFCPIKHAKKIAYSHDFYQDFFTYGDGVDYQKKLSRIREEMQEKKPS
ncbi:MAG: hypothetical protein IE885_02010 [Campylobacterales bacterium]|nr:hypothetical protein [Campylobacterales bacterium]